MQAAEITEDGMAGSGMSTMVRAGTLPVTTGRAANGPLRAVPGTTGAGRFVRTRGVR